MKKNKALAVPFVLWAVLFIAVPLAMVVWYGVTVEETPAYVEVAGDNGQTLFQLEDGTVTADFGAGTLTLADGSVQTYEEPVNERYMREMDYFLDYALHGNGPSVNTPETALRVLKLTLGEE